MNGAAVIQPAPIPFYTVLVLYLGIMAFIGVRRIILAISLY